MNEKEKLRKLKEQLLQLDRMRGGEIERVQASPEVVKQKVKRLKERDKSNIRDGLMFLFVLFLSQISFVVMMYMVFKK